MYCSMLSNGSIFVLNMRFLWIYIKEHKGLLFGALMLAVANQFFSLLDPQIFRIIIDGYANKISVIPQGEFVRGVILLLFAGVGAALVSRIAKNFQDYCVNLITQRVGTQMYSDALDHSLSLPYAIFEDQRSGELLQKLEKARTDSQALITSSVNVIFLSCVGIFFVLIYAFWVHWIIGMIYLLLIPILGLITFLLSKKIRAAQAKVVAKSADLAGSATETIRNVQLVKSLGLEKQEINRLRVVNEKILGLELSKIRLIRTLSFSTGSIINSIRSLLLFLMLWLIFKNSITLGELLSLYFYSFFIFGPLYEVSAVATQFQEARASIAQLDNILKMKPEEKPKQAKVIQEITNISFENVTFSYASLSSPILEKISFHVRSGETIAFAGPTGAGKSTIVKLLVGLYQPSSGKIHYNEIDSQELDFETFRKHVGYVSQETQLFSGTIRENLSFVYPQATQDDCLRVLELSQAVNILERGGRGLDTKIGEGGMKLSGGERQRIAIARALLRNPNLIIFDEATSSLDSLTEQEITKTIEHIAAVKPNLITILVAHRLSTIAYSDKIYVLEKGKIIEQGNHNTLVSAGGLYSALWRQQIATRL